MNYKTAMLSLTVGVLLLMQQCSGQAYHFSKGWMPGKRSQDTTSSTYSHGANSPAQDLTDTWRTLDTFWKLNDDGEISSKCTVWPLVRWTVNKLVQTELLRLDRRCSARRSLDSDDILTAAENYRKATKKMWPMKYWGQVLQEQ